MEPAPVFALHISLHGHERAQHLACVLFQFLIGEVAAQVADGATLVRRHEIEQVGSGRCVALDLQLAVEK